ncbi:catalase-related domain-containing protein, partial [Acinetobacter baumannii]
VMQHAIQKQQPYKQAGDLYRSYSALEKKDLIRNLAADLGQVKNVETKTVMLSYFYKADADYGTRLAKAVGVDLKMVQAKAAQLKDE